MARFGGGWIKLWRRAVEGDLADNMYLWGIWNWLLYAAHWKPSSIIWKGARRDIPAGTVVLGIAELAEKWDCSQATIKKWLTYLKTSDRIDVETCSRGTLVTILNWETYQSPYAERREPSENQVGAEREPSENQVGLIEEGKKERKKEYIPASSLVAERKGLEEQKAVIEECYVAWLDTLAFYKAARPQLSPQEQLEIVRAIQRQGSAKAVLYALRGARCEPKSEKFNPADFLKIERILDAKNISRFLNLGIQAEHKRAEGA